MSGVTARLTITNADGSEVSLGTDLKGIHEQDLRRLDTLAFAVLMRAGISPPPPVTFEEYCEEYRRANGTRQD